MQKKSMEWVTAIRFEPLTTFFKGMTFLGNGTFFYLFLPIIYWCWKKRTGAYIIFLAIIAGYINYMLKNLFAWDRPPTDIWLISTHGYTFPSTHAVMAVIIWGYLAYEIRKTWFTVAAIFLMLFIAFSRVYLGVHYPQDIIAGLAVGGILLHLYRWIIKWSRLKLARTNDIIKGATILLISIFMLIIQPNTLIAAGTGLLGGIYIGFLLEPHFADFDTDGLWYYQLAKIGIGLLISLALWQGMEWLFPEEPSFRYFQFFITGMWMTSGAPWLFIQLRLAKREQ